MKHIIIHAKTMLHEETINNLKEEIIKQINEGVCILDDRYDVYEYDTPPTVEVV